MVVFSVSMVISGMMIIRILCVCWCCLVMFLVIVIVSWFCGLFIVCV